MIEDFDARRARWRAAMERIRREYRKDTGQEIDQNILHRRALEAARDVQNEIEQKIGEAVRQLGREATDIEKDALRKRITAEVLKRHSA